MKKLFSLRLIMTFILALILSGCGGGSNGGGTSPGQSNTCTVGTVSFNIHYVPGAAIFPIRTNDSVTCATVNYPYWMAETEVTYELWYEVYNWATPGHGYTLFNAGSEGGDGTIGDPPTTAKLEPVTYISCRDAMVWCNALTEYYNVSNGKSLDCVYYTDANYTSPLKKSTNNSPTDSTFGSEDMPYIKATTSGNTDMAKCTAKGFRLPTSMEWELAARYKGNDSSNGAIYKGGLYWTPGSYASGANADYKNASATEAVSWYFANSGNSTHPVASTPQKNALGIYDMSGNVWEWCFDWVGDPGNSNRVTCGGAWDNDAFSLQIGGKSENVPYWANEKLGFRFVRTE
jgi:formylglycine-generating enzyme